MKVLYQTEIRMIYII